MKPRTRRKGPSAGPHGKGPRRLVQHQAKAEWRRLQFQLSRLDLRAIQEIVEQCQEQIGRFSGSHEEIPRGRLGYPGDRQVDHPQDGVHRRPQFVTDVRYEPAFCLVCLLGLRSPLLNGLQQSQALHGDGHLVGHGLHHGQFVLGKRRLSCLDPKESVPITFPWFNSGWQA